MTSLDDYAARLVESGEGEDAARLAMGEWAALCRREYGRGGLKQAAQHARRPYKTVYDRARLVDYYEQLLPRRLLAPGDSIARELLEEFPELTWTDLRLAQRLDAGNPWVALQALRTLVHPDKSIEQVARDIQQARRANGHEQTRYVIDNGTGLRVIIERY